MSNFALPGSFIIRLTKLMQQISDYNTSQANWDGFEPSPPTVDAIKNARALVLEFASLGELPVVMTLDDGGILVEVRLRSAIAQTEAMPTGEFEVTLSINGRVAYESDERPRAALILNELQNLLAPTEAN